MGAYMEAGDAQRKWYPEMVERAAPSQWQEGMAFDAMVRLRDDLDAILQRTRGQS